MNNPSSPTGQGLLEQYPHNLVHDWVGRGTGTTETWVRSGTLLSIPSSTSTTRTSTGSGACTRTSGQPIEPDDTAAWYQQWFNFVDIDGTPKSVTVEDAVAAHDERGVPGTPRGGASQTHRELVAVAAALPSKPVPGQARPEKAKAVAVVETPKKTQGEPIRLARQPPAPRGRGRPRRRGPESSPARVQLTDLKYTGKFYVRVFVNLDSADAMTSIDDPHFVGTLVALDSHAAHHEGQPDATTIFRMPISASLSNFYKVAPPGLPSRSGSSRWTRPENSASRSRR